MVSYIQIIFRCWWTLHCFARILLIFPLRTEEKILSGIYMFIPIKTLYTNFVENLKFWQKQYY